MLWGRQFRLKRSRRTIFFLEIDAESTTSARQVGPRTIFSPRKELPNEDLDGEGELIPVSRGDTSILENHLVMSIILQFDALRESLKKSSFARPPAGFRPRS